MTTRPDLRRRHAAGRGGSSPRSRPAGAYCGLRVLELPPGGSQALRTAADEMVVLPLAGSCVVECDGERFELAGRAGVFAGVTDFAYLPRDAVARVTSQAGGRFALPAARAGRRLAPRYGPASGVPVELRGAGSCSRRVDNFCMPGVFPADRLIACEVITPAGNWSSYPPHKHDEERPGETVLEEIYYFEIAPGPAGPGVGFQRVYGTPDRPAGPARRGQGGRCGADPARLARAVDGRARLRHVLPERDGRARRRPGLAGLRRPGPHLGA